MLSLTPIVARLSWKICENDEHLRGAVPLTRMSVSRSLTPASFSSDLRLVQIVGVVAVLGGLVRRRACAHGRLSGVRRAAHDRVGEALAVHGVVERLTHVLVVEGWSRGIEAHLEERTEAGVHRWPGSRVGLEPHEVVDARTLDHVQRAGLELHDPSLLDRA